MCVAPFACRFDLAAPFVPPRRVYGGRQASGVFVLRVVWVVSAAFVVHNAVEQAVLADLAQLIAVLVVVWMNHKAAAERRAAAVAAAANTDAVVLLY